MNTAISLIGSTANETNVELVAEWRQRGVDANLVSASEALTGLGRGSLAIGRLDVLPSLDGVEEGLLDLLWLERRGVSVLNPTKALLVAHDKFRTAHALEAAGLPHPQTALMREGEPSPLEPPLVLKPRFGSWGRDVFRCRDRAELERRLAQVSERPWFRRHGALLQELLPVNGYDLRLIVAAGKVVGAGKRVAARGNWRTNISLGGTLRPADPPPAAKALASAAAAAVGTNLVGVDLMPLPGGGFTILELNGAVDFDERYSQPGGDVYVDAARTLGL
ncbi:MAG: ATP-grasp domain-containing protein, partial [Gaiellaceae bacterium]